MDDSNHKKIPRRSFVRNVALSFLGAKALGSQALTQVNKSILPKPRNDKDDLDILTDRPLNAETPMHLLDDEITPTHRVFVRNNGIIPPLAYKKDLSQWKLKIYGETQKEIYFSLEDLKKRFKIHSYQLVLECGGNGRAGYHPKTPGNQWSYGAVGCPLWKGVRLKDVLEYVGLKKSAVFIAYYGADLHLAGNIKKKVISRGVPISKALEETTLLAFEMNHQPLTPMHGYPLRLICPGYPGSVSGKWLESIWVRDRIHDGAKMNGSAYKLPKEPVAPGGEVSATNSWKIIENMPVKSIITYPKSETKISSKNKDSVHMRGFAWTGDKKVTQVDLSFDYGQTWKATKLEAPKNAFSWQRWSVTIALPSNGYYEIWTRAKDTTGKMQPMVVPGWNPKGYINNAMPRIALNVV